ncbi:MAG: hypothetical protein ACT4OE_06920 [Sphingosinicella sp.]
MRAALLALPLAMLAFPALAQQPGVPAPEATAAAPAPRLEPRVNQLIIYGDDPCPPGTNDEIIVCARLPEEDRFRIPEPLREDPNAAARQSWSMRAIELSYVGRTGAQSCSPVGPGGFTGCFDQMARQAIAERGGGVDWQGMIEQARRERMQRIGEQEAEEADEENSPD